MRCEDLCERLDERLDTDAFAGIDASANGLQVGSAEQTIDHVAVAVDAAVETVEQAADAGADMLLTHHGLFWDGIERLTGKHYRRIAPLLEHDMALYVSHLPLDGHQSLGNAAGVADVLDLDDRAPFGSMGDQFIGQQGTAQAAFTPSQLQETLTEELATGEQSVQLLDFGPSEITDVAIVTGSGVDWLDEAIEADADALVTGEGKQFAYHEAREAGIHVVLGGHYATETFGVRALQGLLDDWELETTYLSHPTGL